MMRLWSQALALALAAITLGQGCALLPSAPELHAMVLPIRSR